MPDNYKITQLKIDIKIAIINVLIDMGLVYSDNGIGEKLDIGKYK